jgi:hypothetical protein
VLCVAISIAVGFGAASLAFAEEPASEASEPSSGDPQPREQEPERKSTRKSSKRKPSQPIPFHLSLGAGFFAPWDGNDGFNVSGAGHVGLGSDRFWVGGEVEYRRFEPELKRDFRPDMNSFALRFSFQYHPWPKAIVSPYVGVSVGVLLNKVDDNHSRVDPNDKLRSDVSGGLTLLGVAGAEVPLGTQRLHLFAEGRLGNSSDLWKRKGGNWQTDQIDGITAMGGLRFRF